MRPSVTFTLLAPLAAAALATAQPGEPPVLRSRLALEPSDLQLLTLPAFPARWYLPAEAGPAPAGFLRDRGLSPALADAIAAAVRTAPDGDRFVVPDSIHVPIP